VESRSGTFGKKIEYRRIGRRNSNEKDAEIRLIVLILVTTSLFF